MDCPGEDGQEQLVTRECSRMLDSWWKSELSRHVSIGREVESALPRNISWCKIKGPRKAYAAKLKLRKDKHRTQVGGKVIAEQNSV